VSRNGLRRVAGPVTSIETAFRPLIVGIALIPVPPGFGSAPSTQRIPTSKIKIAHNPVRNAIQAEILGVPISNSEKSHSFI
jgi:hypothetical protein